MKKGTNEQMEVMNKIKAIWKTAKKWAVSNYKISIPAGVCAVLVIVVVIVSLSGRSKEHTMVEAEADNTQAVETMQEIPLVPLEENAYPAVNQFIHTYYDALAAGDVETVRSLRNYTEDIEALRISIKSEYIDNYDNIICYTKAGPEENSYLVYVTYEVKFAGIDTMVPGANTLYLCTSEDGSLYMNENVTDEAVIEYNKVVSAQEDVYDLLLRADVKYSEVVDSDPELVKFLLDLPLKLKGELGEAVAALEAGNAETDEDLLAAEATQEETAGVEELGEPVQTEQVTIETVKAIDTVNVRSSDSETADKIGKAQAGTTFTRLEERANGWSKIDYQGKEAYIKSEFLEVIDKTVIEAEAGSTAGGKITVKETVNIRKEPNETAEKLGAAYKGEQYELIVKQADGWTKIKYNGGVAYIKSDYVE